MEKLKYKNGLLYTNLILEHEGKRIEIPNVILDTGASHTIILPEYLESMDIGFSNTDTIVKASGYGGSVEYAVRKSIDKICLGSIEVNNIRLDFGQIDPYEKVNGLLGLDFLRQAKVILDLSNDKVIECKNDN